MSRARHEERARGGAAKAGDVPMNAKMQSYAGTGSVVEKDAEKRKRGGGVHQGKMPTMVHGSAPKHHGNRPGRKRGGSVGADSHPMTEAAHLQRAEGMSGRDGVDKEDD